MKDFVQSTGTLIFCSSITLIALISALLINKRHPELSENIIIYVIIVFIGFFIAMRLFFGYPQLGILWFLLWIILLLGATVIGAYRHNQRENKRK